MIEWNSSPHPISDIRDWSELGRLELRPDFQRRAVWSTHARVMLMDTIIRNVPMPKIYLASEIRNKKTYRIVIDGQQRISAILDFLHDKFSLNDPYEGNERGRKFSELGVEVQDRFLSYQIDFNEAVKPSDEEVREVYSRVNKYTVPLTKQELRKADFPGDFLDVSEEFSADKYFEKVGIFSTASRRRYADVEYISELLAAMILGIQDKKKTLDDFYIKYAKWEKSHKKEIVKRFKATIKELKYIFDDSLRIADTRFKQKADFYSLFVVVQELLSEGHTVRGKDLDPLRDDLRTLQENIRPESYVQICSEYAIKCVSQANSASSRKWRHEFLKLILTGTFIGKCPDEHSAHTFYKMMEDLYGPGYGMCPDPCVECPICGEPVSDDLNKCLIIWPQLAEAKQIANFELAHPHCVEKDRSAWIVLERPSNNGQPNLL